VQHAELHGQKKDCARYSGGRRDRHNEEGKYGTEGVVARAERQPGRLGDVLVAPRPGHTRGVRLYICYGTFKSRKSGGHPCRNAYEALVAAGHQPEVTRTYGCVLNPAFKGRRHVKALTGNYQVPTLELDDGTLVDGSERIIAWAKANSVSSGEATTAGH
jgi:hypothetical protein